MYHAILRLRVIARQWQDAEARNRLAAGRRLVNPLFFDDSVYDAPSVDGRLAAAIATAGGTDTEAHDKRLLGVARLLSAPIAGGGPVAA